MNMITDKAPWDVDVVKYGKTYATEFKVGCQGFVLCRVEVDNNTSDEEARHHAIFTQVMFLKALANLGIVKPGGVPDLKTALKIGRVRSGSRMVVRRAPQPSSTKGKSPKAVSLKKSRART
jgi:hypothetical protein